MTKAVLLFVVLAGSFTQLACGQDVKTPYLGNPPFDIKQTMNQHKVVPPQNAKSTGPVSFMMSPYLFGKWTIGILQPYAGPPERTWVKYNATDRQLVARHTTNENEAVRVVDMDLLREFTVGDSLLGMRLTYRRYLDSRVEKATLRTAFYEVHYDAGRTALLCHRNHIPAIPVAGEASFAGTDDVLSYFLKTPTNDIVPVNLKANDILAALGTNHQPALKAYISQQHLDLSREADVVQLLRYHDDLLAGS